MFYHMIKQFIQSNTTHIRVVINTLLANVSVLVNHLQANS